MEKNKFFEAQRIGVVNQSNAKSQVDTQTQLIDSNYEIIKLNAGGQVVTLEKLQIRDVMLILISAALGGGFQFVVGVSMYGLWLTIGLLIIFYLLCLTSCYFIYKVIRRTKMVSYNEMAYFLGGGRASIICISVILIHFYVAQPSQYLITINLSILSFFVDDGSIMGDQKFDPLTYNIGILILGVILLPLSLIRNIQKIRILGYFIIIVDALILLNVGAFMTITGKTQIKTNFNFFTLQTPFNYLSEFCLLFDIQIYYMWGMQSVSDKTIKQKGKSTFFIVATIILCFTVAYAIFSYVAYTTNTIGEPQDFEFQEILAFFQKYGAGKSYYLLNVASIILVFPFKFYIAKEFVFVLYDELVNKSLSSKIDELKQFTSTKGVYTKDMVVEVKEDIYQIIRQPYLKISNKKYYIITLVIYLVNVLTSLSYFQLTEEIKEALMFNSGLKLLRSISASMIMFFIPGYFYYKSCLYFQLDTKKRFIGIALCVFGLSLMVVISSFTMYASILIFKFN